MRRITYILLVTVMILSMIISVYAAPEDKVGVIKAFSEESITMIVNGKDVTYKINENTKVMRIDQEMDLMDIAKKGLKATFKADNNNLIYINIPNMGAEIQGTPRVAVSDLRINTTESKADNKETASIDSKTNEVLTHISTVVKEIGETEDSVYVYYNEEGKEYIDLGDKVIIEGSIKVNLNGKDLKVIGEKDEFNSAAPDDEVKFAIVDGYSNLLFEGKITDNKDAAQADIEKILKVSYKKKMFEVYTTETNFLNVNSEAIIELNGKIVPLDKALAMSNASLIRTNPDGELIHLDAFYKGVNAEFLNLNKNEITVNVIKNGKIVGQEVLTLAEGVTVSDKDGAPIELKDLKANDNILITTEPAEGYSITSITKK
ncbi:MAG TPA: hypothetical protein DHV55_02245 [Clostridiaceae bacterium]|nr:hypothetical protein [Clostridiaceae bacterium]